MKTIKYIITACTAILFISCSNDSGGGSSSVNYSFPEGETAYTIPADTEYINLPSSMNGKKCFVIYSNEQTLSQLNTMDNAIIENENESRSVDNGPEMIINKGAVDLGNGLLRDEVHFDIPEELKKKTTLNRSGASSNNYSTYRSLSNNQFYARTTQNSDSLSTFSMKCEGTHCRIWYLNNSSLVDESKLNFESLKNTIDQYFEKETQIFGSNAFSGYGYITANSSTMLDVLVYDLFGDARAEQNSGTFGFFKGYDFLINAYLNDLNTANSSRPGFTPYSLTSNEYQVINIDSYFLQLDYYNKDGTAKTSDKITHQVESTLFHEFEHLLNLCNKNSDYSTWFTEMLAMCSEDIFNLDHPSSRFNIYFDKPYIGFKNWPGNDDNNILYAYSNAYAFGAYLMRNYGGIRLIHEIATNAYVDEQAITEALKTLGFNETFSSVFKKFGAVYINTDYADSYSLNRNIDETFAGNNYNLIAINLNDFYMSKFSNYTQFLYETKTNLYYPSGIPYYDSEGHYYIKGPRIFRSSYIMPASIQKYGFAVYYAGDIQSGKSLKVKHKSNLDMTVVVK